MSVRGELSGRVYWVTLERPEKLNALNKEMWIGLAEQVRRGCGLRDATVVAIRGAGGSVCRGDDIRAMLELSDLGEAEEFFQAVAGAVKAIVDCPKPVIAAVHGYAFGGCMEILLVVDIVVASHDALFSAPEARLALIPPILSSVGALSLGLRRAKYLAMTMKVLTAEEAKSAGIVDEVVDKNALYRRVEELAEELAKIPPHVLSSIKKLANSLIDDRLLQEAMEMLKEMVISDEAKDRMRAFLEKRLT